jgi:hypothetical protein
MPDTHKVDGCKSIHPDCRESSLMAKLAAVNRTVKVRFFLLAQHWPVAQLKERPGTNGMVEGLTPFGPTKDK